VLASIETDKAVVDFAMQEDGYIAKLLVEEGAKDVPLGQVIAVLVESLKDIPAFANYSASAAPPQAAPVVKEAPKAQSTASYPDHVALEMPNLSPTMEKVRNQSNFLGKHHQVAQKRWRRRQAR